jgi:DNA-directed RNA polymerase specialized sigma24 family protein
MKEQFCSLPSLCRLCLLHILPAGYNPITPMPPIPHGSQPTAPDADEAFASILAKGGAVWSKNPIEVAFVCEEIVRRWKPGMIATGMRILHNYELAENAFQETMESWLKGGFATVHPCPIPKFRGWCWKCYTRECLKILGEIGRNPVLPPGGKEPPQGSCVFELPEDAPFEVWVVHHCLRKLSETDQKAIKEYLEPSQNAAPPQTAQKKNRAKVALFRAIQALDYPLKPWCGVDDPERFARQHFQIIQLICVRRKNADEVSKLAQIPVAKISQRLSTAFWTLAISNRTPDQLLDARRLGRSIVEVLLQWAKASLDPVHLSPSKPTALEKRLWTYLDRLRANPPADFAGIADNAMEIETALLLCDVFSFFEKDEKDEKSALPRKGALSIMGLACQPEELRSLGASELLLRRFPEFRRFDRLTPSERQALLLCNHLQCSPGEAARLIKGNEQAIALELAKAKTKLSLTEERM